MDIKSNMLKYEELLSSKASKSKDAIRFISIKEDIRPNYFRDIDKILHSKAYSRYMGKTQVYSNKLNDHITTRGTHVQFVSKVSRTIARGLNLNEDLCEAIAIGHDLGHVPFGHEGEYILNDLSLEMLGERFNHNVQSIRVLMYIENKGKGINLSLQVLDGIMCHNGEFVCDKYRPVYKTKEEFIKLYKDTYIKDVSLIPMTLEGCIVRISDMIAYIGRDIEDYSKLYEEELCISKDIKEVLGSNNKEIINNIVLDIITNSLDKDYISMSKKVYDMLVKLKKFNYEHIYKKAITDNERKEYKDIFYYIYNKYLKEIEDKNSNIYKLFLNDMSEEYLKNKKERIIIDYIAGMTDRYLLNEYKRLKEN